MSSNVRGRLRPLRWPARVAGFSVMAMVCWLSACTRQDRSAQPEAPGLTERPSRARSGPSGLAHEPVRNVGAPLTNGKQARPTAGSHTNEPASFETAAVGDDGQSFATPSIAGGSARQNASTPTSDSRFAANSPFTSGRDRPAIKQEKRLWAASFLWSKAPELSVEKWLTGEPDTAGKYVLIEFWATWCTPCRRSITLLNRLHERHADELVVIGISDEREQDVRKMTQPEIKFYSAIDTQARMKKQLRVQGIPHTIILEPNGYVIWEGFPLLEGYELTDDIIEKILAVGRRLREED